MVMHRLLAVVAPLALLLSGCASTPSPYPESYLLAEDELPPGLALIDPPPEWPFSGNPAEVPRAWIRAILLQEFPEEIANLAPDALWLEVLDASDGGSGDDMGGLVIAAAKWDGDNELDERINALVDLFGEAWCQDAQGVAILRDVNVLVFAYADEHVEGALSFVVAQLQEKTPALDLLCLSRPSASSAASSSAGA